MFNPGNTTRPEGRAVIRVPLDHVALNPSQPRRQLSQASVAALAESIRLHGLLSPLLVRAVGRNRYLLVAGERRLRALRLLGRDSADAILLDGDDCACDLIALVENLQREDLHFLDAAAACRRMLDAYPITQERLAANLGCSPSALANRLRLLKLPLRVQAEVRRRELGERHARALLKLESEAAQLELVQRAGEQRLSARQLEDLVAQRLREPPKRRKISRVVRDHRIIVNALLDTVRELTRIGVPVKSRIEEQRDRIDVIVTIPLNVKDAGSAI